MPDYLIGLYVILGISVLVFTVIIFFMIKNREGGEQTMNIQKFADEVTKKEGKKVSVNKGQVLEIMKIINEKTDGALYREIRKINK